MTVGYEKKVELYGEYDVVVVGGGTAGASAAIEAARNGANTLLVEASGMLGGMATTALVGPFMTCYDRDGNEKIVSGLFDEIVERTVAKGGAIRPQETDSPSVYTSHIEKYHRHVTPFDSFALELALDELAAEAGVHVLLYTRFVDSICRDGKIDTLILAALEGLIAVKGKVIIDCSGNADVAAVSGVETWKGTEDGEAAQPGTLFFEVDNVDDERYTARAEGPVKAYMLPEGGAYKVNHYRVFGVDAANSDSMTKAHTEGRRQVVDALNVLHRTAGFENARLAQVAPVFGVRESRHIKGQYMLTVQDLAEGRVFEDGVLCFGYGMDVHPRNSSMHGNWKVEVAPVYTIPYRCMVPVGCDNLLVSGKNICAQSQAAGSARVMPACMGLGQAAGAAAALAAEKGCTPAEVDAFELRELLKKHGATLK